MSLWSVIGGGAGLLLGGPAGAAVGAGLGSALDQSNSASKAVEAQTNAATAANDTSRYMYDTTRQDNMPALQARNASLAKMRTLLGIDGSGSAATLGGSPTAAQVQAEPGYQFGLDQGQKAMQRQASARGMLNSGNALLGAQRYGQDYAGTKYDAAFNRLQAGDTATFNRLASVGQLGQTGSNAITYSGTNAANNIAANQVGVGNAQAAGSIASGNAWANAGNQLAGWYGNQANGGNALNPSSNWNTWATQGTGAD